MTIPETHEPRWLDTELRVYVPAIVIMFFLAFLLRSTSLSSGARTAIPFFLFVLLQDFFRNRAKGERGSARSWLASLLIAIVSALGMWLIAEA